MKILSKIFFLIIILININSVMALVDCTTCNGVCDSGMVLYNCGAGSAPNCALCGGGYCSEHCSIGSCGATCTSNANCADTCTGNTRYYGKTCDIGGACTCNAGSSQDCTTLNSAASDTDGGYVVNTAGTCTAGNSYTCQGAGVCTAAGGSGSGSDVCSGSTLTEYQPSGINCANSGYGCTAETTCTSQTYHPWSCTAGACYDTGGVSPDASSTACTGCSDTWYSTVTGGSGGPCCGNNGGDSFYYASGSLTTDTSVNCQYCSGTTNYGPGTYYGNGYLLGSGTSRICYYGDISCSGSGAANGASTTILGWGNYSGSNTTSTSLNCYSGTGSCGDGTFSNGTNATLFGNGYATNGNNIGSICYYGEISCSNGVAINGTSCTIAVNQTCVAVSGCVTSGSSCTYGGTGNWTVTNNCSLNISTQVNGNYIVFNGSITVYLNANITNWTNAWALNGATVIAQNGGGLRR